MERPDPLDGDFPVMHEVTHFADDDRGPHRLRFACAVLLALVLALGMVAWGVGLWGGWWA